MIIIRNKIIPVKGFKCINLFGVLFVRKEYGMMLKADLNHEAIHTAQMRELLYVPFYVLYLIEWICRLFLKGYAYRNISFEQEAYDNQFNFNYLNRRKYYSWIKYLRRNRK
ncbi:MAG: hypothetical protein NC344_05635 [Bacteroidales bacterium]|nr:hypothetical protein [Bacteroidales bacterium]MCM1147301.1 hypothetical protein [Bacteroidales bacterium]MCM1206265.1 hypothetical protein [Bacillota bacterium]